MTREELSPKASEMLKAHNLDEVFVCSDGQGFTEEHRAIDHARYLKNKKVEHFAKSKAAVEKEIDEDKQEDERIELVAKYEKLFGKKPNHNTGIEKLKTQIAEKEAELAQSEEPIVQDATQTEENPAGSKEDLKEV